MKRINNNLLLNKETLLVGILLLSWFTLTQVTTAAPTAFKKDSVLLIKDLLKRAEERLDMSSTGLQPVVDLIQVVKWPLNDQSSSSSVLKVKESRLAFGVAEDHYSNNNIFYMLGYQDSELKDAFVYLLVDSSLQYIITLKPDTKTLVLEPFKDVQDPMTHFVPRGSLRNCIISTKEGEWKLSALNETPTVIAMNESGKGGETYFNIRSLGSTMLVK